METKMKTYELIDALVAVDKSIKVMWENVSNETNPEVKKTIYAQISKAHNYSTQLKNEFYQVVGLQII